MKFPDTAPATITLAYKSGQTHIHETDVADARKRAETAIRRKSIKWIRVSIPHPTESKEVRFYYSPYSPTKWERTLVILPRTKDQ